MDHRGPRPSWLEAAANIFTLIYKGDGDQISIQAVPAQRKKEQLKRLGPGLAAPWPTLTAVGDPLTLDRCAPERRYLPCGKARALKTWRLSDHQE